MINLLKTLKGTKLKLFTLIKVITILFLIILSSCKSIDNPNEQSVDPAKLSELIKQADKIVVLEAPVKDAKTLFASTDPKDIVEFNNALTLIVPGYFSRFICACIGGPAIYLYRNNEEIVTVINQGGTVISNPAWDSDAKIKDTEKWLQWFDTRKISQPRKEFEEALMVDKQNEVNYAKWLAAMPKSIQPLWSEAESSEPEYKNIKPLQEAIAKQFPNPQQRSLELFAWYGSGAGPWSGFPSYEEVADQLLLTIPTSDLVSAAQSKNLSEAQIEGAARLFAGWNFYQQRQNDLKLLPATLKKKLLDHSLKSKDKINRAIKAFS